LDNGGNFLPGNGNGKISQHDIDDVQTQNQHLSVLRDNLNIFDDGQFRDGDYDGTISVSDLRDNRDNGTPYSIEIIEAAEFILENREKLGLGNQGDISFADVHNAWLALNG